jgi:Peptidase inhibitor I78 family
MRRNATPKETPMRRPALILTCVALAACVPAEPPVMPPPLPPEDACGAPGLHSLVGQSATVLETMRFGQQVRIIRPGMAVTMDYREDRLNIEIDKRETIIRVACG